MKKQDKILTLCKAVLEESKQDAGDYMDLSWNKDAHVNITLTIKEVRLAHEIFYGKGFKVFNKEVQYEA